MPNAYVCRKCGHKVIRQVFGTENGQHEEWFACLNPDTIHFWGLPHREKDWEYNDFRDEDLPLEPWQEKQTFENFERIAYGQTQRDIQVTESIVAAVTDIVSAIAPGIVAAPKYDTHGRVSQWLHKTKITVIEVAIFIIGVTIVGGLAWNEIRHMQNPGSSGQYAKHLMKH